MFFQWQMLAFFLAYPHSQVFLANPEFPDSKIPNLQQKHKHYHLHRLGVICSPPKKYIATAWLFFFASQQKKVPKSRFP